MKLNEKQKLFCREYIVDFNRTQAAIRAGYSKKTARFQAYHLSTNIYIQEYIKKLIEKRKMKIDVEEEEIIAELKKIGFSDIGNVKFKENGEIDISKIDTSLINKIYTSFNKKTTRKQSKVELHSKIKALELLMKYKGMLIEKSQIDFNDITGLEKEEIEKLKGGLKDDKS